MKQNIKMLLLVRQEPKGMLLSLLEIEAASVPPLPLSSEPEELIQSGNILESCPSDGNDRCILPTKSDIVKTHCQ